MADRAWPASECIVAERPRSEARAELIGPTAISQARRQVRSIPGRSTESQPEPRLMSRGQPTDITAMSDHNSIQSRRFAGSRTFTAQPPRSRT